MTLLLCTLALLIGAVIASVAWCLGYGSGYSLGVAHGRETADAEAEAEALPPTTQVQTSAFLAALDRRRETTFGVHGTRADALELM